MSLWLRQPAASSIGKHAQPKQPKQPKHHKGPNSELCRDRSVNYQLSPRTQIRSQSIQVCVQSAVPLGPDTLTVTVLYHQLPPRTQVRTFFTMSEQDRCCSGSQESTALQKSFEASSINSSKAQFNSHIMHASHVQNSLGRLDYAAKRSIMPPKGRLCRQMVDYAAKWSQSHCICSQRRVCAQSGTRRGKPQKAVESAEGRKQTQGPQSL